MSLWRFNPFRNNNVHKPVDTSITNAAKQLNPKEESVPKFTCNYHQHPEVGGMGHVSLACEYGDEKVELSVYPHAGPTIFQPLSHLSFYMFPTKAIHKPIATHEVGYSPITASYVIPPSMIPYPQQAYTELKKIRENIDSGHAGFSITPNPTTHIIHAIVSPRASTIHMLVGLKMLDREMINRQTNKLMMVNCASSVSQVLSAGGLPKTEGIFSYPTPSGINSFFNRHVLSTHSPVERKSDAMDNSMAEAVKRGFND